MIGAAQDTNQFPALIAHQDLTSGSIQRIVADASGAMLVNTGGANPLGGNNPSLVLSYDSSGKLITIAKTIGATTYTKSLTYTGSNLTGVGVWA